MKIKRVVIIDGKKRYSVRCLHCGKRQMRLMKHPSEIDGTTCYCGMNLYDGRHDPRKNIAMADMRAVEHIKRDVQTTCGPKCQSATGFTCDCQCGGINHGCN